MNYSASIGDDPVDRFVTRHCRSAEQAARAAREYAELGETITVIGPRGGVTRWRAVGTGLFKTVWRTWQR